MLVTSARMINTPTFLEHRRIFQQLSNNSQGHLTRKKTNLLYFERKLFQTQIYFTSRNVEGTHN